MKVVLMKLAVWILRFIYLIFMPMKLKNRIVIISRQADKPTIDIKLLSKEFEHRNVECVVLTKRLNKTLLSGIKYGLHMMVQMYYIATSKVVILDGYCILISILPKKDKQKVIQMWHALGAIKKFGYQSVGKRSGNKKSVAKAMKLHRNYDYVIAASEITGRYFCEAFDIDENKIRYLGLPRIDYLLRENTDICEKVKKSYPHIFCKPIVLYVPTFRKNERIEMIKLIQNFNFEKFNLVIKKHWIDRSDYTGFEKFGAIIDKKINSMDWLSISSKVITDYSAVAFEAAILNKELYLYIPDIEDYKESVGLNMEFSKESLSGYTYVDARNLCDELEYGYDKYRVELFKKKYVEIETLNCTEKLAAFTLAVMEEQEDLFC